MESIPPQVLHADLQHHRIMERVPFSRHLNPKNAPEARAAFRAGRHSPPFEYHPLDEADEILWELDAIEPPRDHPAGALVGEVLDGTRTLVIALRDRSAAAFDAMARSADWYPTAQDLIPTEHSAASDEGPANLPANVLIARLRKALDERDMREWGIERDPVMSARVLVDGAKRLLRVHPGAWFRERDLVRLVVHEIDVHAWRSANGSRQALRCFGTGLPGSIQTEEGLALVAEEHAGVATPGGLARQQHVLTAIDHARTAGFREVYQRLSVSLGSEMAWAITTRVKRGLAHPDEPGVYAKDSVYLLGYRAVRAWLAAGGPLEHLYVGKVGIQHPVQGWLDQGWVRPRPLPPVWRTDGQARG